MLYRLSINTTEHCGHPVDCADQGCAQAAVCAVAFQPDSDGARVVYPDAGMPASTIFNVSCYANELSDEFEGR